MSDLVEEGVYKMTRMYDYQGLCPEEQDTSNPASLISTVRNLVKMPFFICVQCSILNFVKGLR